VIVAMALVLLAGVSGLGWMQSHTSVQPAGVETELGMPDQIWAADEHLPGTDDTGPIGPLVAVAPSVRDSWLGDPEDALIGISATGEYAFLDLPHAISSVVVKPALSADGRYVAYWRTGTPSGEPGDITQTGDRTPPVGVAVYDTVTGRTYEHLVETVHGLQPENLVWAGDRLWFDVWQMDAPRPDGQSASREQVLAWDPVRDVVQDVDSSLDLFRAGAWGDAVLVTARQRLVRATLTSTETLGRLSRDLEGFMSPLFPSPDGTRLAGLAATDAGNGIGPVLVGELGSPDPSGVLALAPVGRTGQLPVGGLVGWRDPDHLVTIDYGAGTGEATYQTLNVTSGAMEILGYAEGNEPILAADALRGPVFEAPEPPTPLDPLLLVGAGAVTVVAAGLGLLWWRRRVQR
jgi:hypothetical protein